MLRMYVRLEVARMASDKRFLILMLAMPVAMYLLFTNLFGEANNRPANGLPPDVGAMVSMAAFGAIGAVLTATGPRIAQERTTGWMRQLRIMPVTIRAVLAGKVLAAMVWALPAIILVFGAAVLDHGVSLSVAQWLEIGGLLWIGAAPFAALGVLIGYLTDDASAFPVLYGVYLFLGAVGGLWMPVDVLPTALQHIAHVLPSNRVAEFGWTIAAGHRPPLAGTAILLGWLGAFAGLAALAYRRGAAR
ncbi:ABC transporter permease [Dactylosporangium sp. NPDC048998]|uniref:ABC transporter permease n=1 Tax=Dactylosporangium sp. NPDC048998 TaxID=3363976 RepID=UPI0037232C44